MVNIKSVRVLLGASAYACIATDTSIMDVKLSSGRSAAKSLRESAKDLREKADRMIKNAETYEAAASFVE